MTSRKAQLTNQSIMRLEIYKVYDQQGKEVSDAQWMEALDQAEVIFFGEEHDNVISHWLQQELYKKLAGKRPVVVGLEMIERDQNAELQSFMKGDISYDQLSDSIKLWNNFSTDYLPIVESAKADGNAVVGTNIPRRYASMVFKKGMESLDTLSDLEKSWMAPLPIPYDATLPGYVNMLTMMGDHASETFPMAQAVKDAAMAYFTTTNMKPNTSFLHLNGSYHSDNYEGILWYMNQYRPNTKMLTITTVTAEKDLLLKADDKGKADYIIVVSSTFPRSYRSRF